MAGKYLGMLRDGLRMLGNAQGSLEMLKDGRR